MKGVHGACPARGYPSCPAMGCPARGYPSCPARGYEGLLQMSPSGAPEAFAFSVA